MIGALMRSSRDRCPLGSAVPEHGALAQQPCRRATLALSALVWLAPPVLRADDDCLTRCAMAGTDPITLQANENCVRNCRSSTQGGVQGPHYDPCYLAQNALRPCTAEQRQAPNPVGVDRKLVGTWELSVPNAQGVARWFWEIHANGSYGFHAQGPGAAPPHHGTFAAANGRYILKSTTSAWNDTGTYQITAPDTLVAAGRLGTGAWHRVRPSTAGDAGAQPANALAGPKR